MTNNGQTVDLLCNDVATRQNSLLVRTIGVNSNRDGVGARLKVTSAGRTQVREVKTGSSYLSQNDPRVHVGLGATSRVDRLEVRARAAPRSCGTYSRTILSRYVGVKG